VPLYSSQKGGLRPVGDLRHTVEQVSHHKADANGENDSLKGGGVALGYPAVLRNGVHRWTIRAHSNVWMIGFATDVWLKELPGCQAQPGCWLLGSDGSRNDVYGSRNFGIGFAPESDVILELWLDGTQATMKFAPEFQVLTTMCGVNFAAAPHKGSKIYPVVFGLRGTGKLASVVAYDGPQPFALEDAESSLITCHRAQPSTDNSISITCTSRSGNELAVVSCELSGTTAELKAVLATNLGKPVGSLTLMSVEGCLFTGEEPLSELILNEQKISCRNQQEEVVADIVLDERMQASV